MNYAVKINNTEHLESVIRYFCMKYKVKFPFGEVKNNQFPENFFDDVGWNVHYVLFDKIPFTRKYRYGWLNENITDEDLKNKTLFESDGFENKYKILLKNKKINNILDDEEYEQNLKYFMSKFKI